MKFHHHLMTLLLLTIFSGNTTYSDDPPTPIEVANTVSNLWINSDFGALTSYITNLYSAHSNYVPAILASSFHDVIFRGRLSDATNKLYRVQSLISAAPENYSDPFKDIFDGLNNDVSDELLLHVSMGTTQSQLESNASPSSVRNASSRLDRDIMILFYAPATNAP